MADTDVGEGAGGNEGGNQGGGNLAATVNRGAGDGGQQGEGGGQKFGDGNSWFSGFQNEDLAKTAENKGWDSPEAVVNSYVELERMARGKLDGYIRLPGDDASDEQKAEFFKAWGRPDEAAQYQVAELQNVQEGDNVADWFTGVAFEAGLNQDQYNAIMAAYDEMLPGLYEAQEAEQEQAARQGMGELESKWGPDFHAKIAVGNRAVKALGLEQEEIVKLQDVLGAARATEILVGVGALVGSDGHVGLENDGGGAPFNGDVAWMQSELDKITGNKDFQEAMKNPAMAASNPVLKNMIDKYNRLNEGIAKAKTG